MEEDIRSGKEREPGSTYFGFCRSLSPINEIDPITSEAGYIMTTIL